MVVFILNKFYDRQLTYQWRNSMFTDLNCLAVAACVLSSFVLGGIWYNVLFKKFYGDECKNKQGSHPSLVFLTAFILWIISALAFAVFLGPKPELNAAVWTAVLIGGCFIATSFGVNYAFAGRRLSIFLIDAGYHFLQFVLYGVILGLWH
jgi:hypothetical protein